MENVWRKFAVVAAAVVVSSLGVVDASTVSAAVTATTVTTVTGVPAGYTIDNEDAASQPTVTATGTAPGAVAGDHVDVRCYYGDDNQDDFHMLEAGVPVTSGMWTASGPLSNIAGYSCWLVAVPSGTTVVLGDPSSASFGRSRLLTTGLAESSTTTDGAGHTTAYDDYLSIPSSKANNELDSVTGCGPYSTLVTAAPHHGHYLWDCVVDLYTSDRAQDGDTPPAIDPVRIGGHSADTGSALKYNALDLPLSHGDLRYSYSQNKSTGDAVVMEADPYYFCQTASHTIDDTINPGDCATWLYTGVTLHRTYGFNHGGQSFNVTDRFVSTAKTKKSLLLEYENDLNNDTSVMRLPGGSGYSTHTAEAINTSSWPKNGSLYARDDPAVPHGSIDAPLGSLTWSTRPTSAYLYNPDEFFLNYTRSLPAGGSFTITHRVALAASQGVLNSLTAANQKANVPVLRLKHLPAKTHKRSLTLHGTVVNGGNGPITRVVATLAHHHHAATVTRRGTFTLHLKLKRGVNHITVTGSDPTRHKASAKAKIRYRP